MDVEKETKKIYKEIENNIHNMNGIITGRRGRITDLFSIDVDFNNSYNYNKMIIFAKLEELKFEKMEEHSTYDSVVFCRNKSGFVINGDKNLTIDYKYKMFYCFNIK